jgi:hypothetical protein
MEPREMVRRAEARAALPSGNDERFTGYGIMGLPFRSGHVLAMRRFGASSVGPGYTSIWHRAASGAWTFYADVAPRLSCTRYFGAMAARAIETPITIAWTGPDRFTIAAIAERLEWEVRVGATFATRLMNAVGTLMPDAAWRNPALLGAMEPLAGALLGVGRVGLHGRAPNGQRFVANPLTVWAIVESRAVLAGEDLGPPGPVEPQARLGDFWVPQRGIFALGRAFFEPFDAGRHSSRTAGGGPAVD